MIKHIVLYNLKDDTAANRQALIAMFLSMKGKIEQLVDIAAGSDVLGSERSFSVALECVFASIEDMNIYKNHPVHLPVMAYVKQVVERSHSVDYVI